MPIPSQLPSSVNVALLSGYTVSRYVARGSYGMVFAGSYTAPNLNTSPSEPPKQTPVAIKMIKDFLCGLDPSVVGIAPKMDASNPLQESAPPPRTGTASDGRHFSDHYRSVYIKRIVRELQILRYFKGCYEFIELLDAYFSPDGRDLYLVMPFVSFSARSLLSATAKTQMRLYMKASAGAVPTSLSTIPPMGLPEDVVRVIMVQLLSGLHKMEKSNCGHRDLTANNILVESDSLYTYLCDFGLSRAHMAAEDNMTLEVVTQPYRAPELLFQCAKYDQAIDIWSAGIVMFELLTGSVPVLEKDVPRQLLSVLEMVSPGGKPDLAYWKAKGAKESALKYIAMKVANGTNVNATRDVGHGDGGEDEHREPPPSSQYGLIRSTLQVKRTGKHLLSHQDGLRLASHFSQEHLSDAGIEVLESLLHEKPEMRKSYEELLNMRWFQDNIDCREQLAVMSTQLPSGHAAVAFASHPRRQDASTATQIPNIERMTLGEQIQYLASKLVTTRADRVVSVQIDARK